MSINSIYSKLSTLVETKRLLRQAIIDKGVPVKKDRDTFRDYVTKINNIVQESPHGKNAPYIDDSLVFCEDYSEIQASKLNLASDSPILDMECPFTVELSFVLDSSAELTQSFETFIDFSFVRIGAQRVSEQQLYLMYGEHLPSDPSFWSYTMWLTDNSNPTSDCILPKDQVVTITCVRYSDHALIYKNGELIITSEESFTELFDTAFSIYRPFDADAAGYHSVINTTINNVRIYNKALNENEIYYNYSIDLLNNGNTQYLNTNHIKSGLVYGINPILPLTGINSHDNVSNYNNHFDNLSIPISLQNGFTIEWRGSISDIMSNDNEPYDYTGRLFTFKNSNGTDTFEVCATIDSEDTDIFDISFKASDEYLIDSEDWLEVFSDTLPSIKFSSDFTLSITVSSTAVNVYINGVLEASSSTYQNKFTNANLWKILYLFTNSLESPLQGTDGFLYSLRIYNRVLNEYEINYNYKVDTRSDIKNPDPLYGKAILGELGNMTLNASGVIIPKAFNCAKPFEIVSCFKMKSDESENDKNFALFGSSDASNYSAYPSIEIRPYTNKLWVGVSINPNNWTYTQEVDLSDIPIVYDNNVLNWIKMEYDGDKIYLSHSIDCLSWTRFHTITGIVPYNPVTNDYTLIFGAKLQNSDLTYTYKSDGETSFSFMNSWVKSCNKTIWGREIMGQELYTNNSTVLVPNGDVRYNAGSFIAYPNLDMSDDFEVVVCLAIDKTAMTSSQTYYLAGGITSSTSNFRIYATYYNIGYQIFYGTHTVAEDDVSWENTVSNFIYNGGVQNFLKLKKRDGKVSFYHSLDAINWSLLNEVEIDPETFTNLQDDGIRFGNAGSDTSTALPMTDTSFINLHNSYVKVNGEIVWGREIREKAQVYAPEIKTETITILKSIKSTGNSVIPTNIIPDYDWSVFLDAKFENPHSTRDADIVFGILRSDEHFFIAMQQGSGWASYTAISGYTVQSGDTFSIGDTTSITRNLGMRQCCIMRRGTNKKCSFGDLSFKMTVKTTDSVPYKPITIMGTIKESTETLNPFNHYDATLYGIQIMDASEKLIHNFVPALSNISKRAGMYDLITETFYQSDKNFDDFEIEYINDESNNNYYDNIVAPVTFLKSVKSVGNSVVQTDIALDFDWEVHMSVMFSGTRRSTSPTYSFFGVGGSDPWFTAESADGTSVAFYIGFDNNSNPAITFNGMEPNTIIPIVARRNGDCICGNEYDSISDSVTGNPHSFGAAFFGVSTGSSTVLPFAYYDMTIYNVDIVDSTGSIIHKLVPAENNVGRGGLFDLVTNKFYPADNRYDDLIKDYGSNATRSPYNVYRILNPGEYKQNGMLLSLSDFTDNANYYTYTLPIASSAGFTFEINLSFGDFENRSGISSSDVDDGHPVVTLFDSRNDDAPNNDRYGLRIICYSDNSYEVELHKNDSWVFSRNLSTPLYIPRGLHTFTMTVENNGIAKAYVDGEFWISTAATGNIGILTRKFYIFTNANTSTGWTLYPQYRTVNRVMLYNRALTEQEILENRKADIVNFGE